jgi:hypothetical protein
MKPQSKAKTFQYVSQGLTFQVGETPLCTICEERIAAWETPVSGIVLCDDADCKLEFVHTECYAIEKEEITESEAEPC